MYIKLRAVCKGFLLENSRAGLGCSVLFMLSVSPGPRHVARTPSFSNECYTDPRTPTLRRL
jgi:hypothetical protein